MKIRTKFISSLLALFLILSLFNGTGISLSGAESDSPAAAALSAAEVIISTTSAGTVYYINSDPDAGSDGNDGKSESTPWLTIQKINNTTFQPGDKILFNCGSSFNGMLSPKGSGSEGAPITIGSYGSGSRPVINGGETNEAAVLLYDQEYWVIQDIETVGGARRGISISGSENKIMHYFRIINCYVHDVKGESTKENDKDNGCIILSTYTSTGSAFSDVLIENCTASDTTRWAGIMVFGNYNGKTGVSTYCDNVTIRNCTAYNLYGDGIVIFVAQNCLIDHCVAHDIGNDPTLDVGTPNAIWTWDTKNAVVQYCEAYNTHSPGVDGGGFDIDFFNENNIVQYCYAHDCDSYGVSIFGASNGTTVNSVVRYNIFANNGREADGAAYGDIYLCTWDGGTIDGVKIYNNTSFWNPNGLYACFNDKSASYSGSNPNLFINNLIYSNVGQMANIRAGHMSLNNNTYWHTGSGCTSWKYGGKLYSDFSQYQAASGQDGASLVTNPLLYNATCHSTGLPTDAFTLQTTSPTIGAGIDIGNMGNIDFFGNTLTSTHNIGAYEGLGVTSESIAIGAEAISLDKAAVTLDVGATVPLKATITPDTSTDVKIAWSSDHPEIATVDANGIIAGVSAGTAVIRGALVSDVGKYAECTVTVEKFDSIQDSITNFDKMFAHSEGWMASKGKIMPYPVMVPAEPQSFTYRLSDIGTFTFGAAYYYWGKLNSYYDYNTWTFNISSLLASGKLTDDSDFIFKFRVYVSPDGSDTSWSRINVNTAYTNYDDGAYTYVEYTPTDPIPAGTNFIKFELYDSDVGWSTVPYKANITGRRLLAPVSGITISQDTLTLEVSDYTTLKATVTPAFVRNSDVAWKSDNTNIASVDQFGFVKAVGPGTTTISAISADNSAIFDVCTVKVNNSLKISDQFENLNRTYSHTGGWVQKNGVGTWNGNADTLCLWPASSTPGSITYKLHDIETFSISIAYSAYSYVYEAPNWDGKSHYPDTSYYGFKVFVSPDNKHWRHLAVKSASTGDDYWTLVTYTQKGVIPKGMNFIRFEVMDNDQGWTTQLSCAEITRSEMPPVPGKDKDKALKSPAFK